MKKKDIHVVRSIAFLVAVTVSFNSHAYGAASDFTIEFSHKPAGLQDCNLIFNRSIPNKAEVDALLRKSLDICLLGNRDTDILAMAFLRDDTLDSPRHYSGSLTYRHKSGQVRTQAQEEGLKQSAQERPGYSVFMEERTRPAGIPGPRHYITVSLVFAKAPPPTKARAIAMQEAGRLSDRGSDVTVSAFEGEKSKALSWKQIRNGRAQVQVHYDAKTKSISDGW